MTIWVKNIARKTILLATMLLIGYCYANAQNTPGGPYIDSWHQYTVTMGDDQNTPTWRLEKAGERGAPINIDGTEDWVTITDNDEIQLIAIKFEDDNGFDTGDKWYLVYDEKSIQTGECVALREFEIDIAVNSFYLDMEADYTTCNSNDGDVFNWDTQLDGIPQENYIDYTITMNKASDFTLNSWECTVALTLGVGNYSFVSASAPDVTSTGGGSITVNDSGGKSDITISVDGPTNAAATSDAITLRVYLSGYVYNDEVATIAITDETAKARSGEDYEVVTDDNGSGDNNQTITINPLPATTNITITD